MKTLIRSAAIPLALGVGLAFAGTACTPSHQQHPIPAAERSQASSILKQLTAKCIPGSAVAQVRLAQSLATKGGRQALITRCGIPPQHKAAFEAEVLSAVEHGHLTTKGGRTEFFSVTLPAIIVKEQ